MSQYSGIVNFVNEQKNIALVQQEEVTSAYPTSAVIGIGDGIRAQFFGELDPKVNWATIAFTVAGAAKTASSSSTGVISGADVGTGINTLDVTTGAVAICFDGVAGTPATLTGTIDITDTSTGYLDLSDEIYQLTLLIDGKTFSNISFGSSASTTPTDIIERFNEVVGYNVATATSSGLIVLTGTRAITGEVITCTGDLSDKLGLTSGVSVTSVSPTGDIPAVNEVVAVSATSEYSDSSSEVHTLVKGDFTNVAVGDKIYYDYTYAYGTATDSKEIVIS